MHEIDRTLLVEPSMTPDDWADYREGWSLFNKHEFWHAHEAWERIWKRKREESRVFFQGIIQLAAAYHLLLVKKRYGGMMRNFEKAEEKLRLFPEIFLHVDVTQLLRAICDARAEILRLGSQRLDEFNPSLIRPVDVSDRLRTPVRPAAETP